MVGSNSNLEGSGSESVEEEGEAVGDGIDLSDWGRLSSCTESASAGEEVEVEDEEHEEEEEEEEDEEADTDFVSVFVSFRCSILSTATQSKAAVKRKPREALQPRPISEAPANVAGSFRTREALPAAGEWNGVSSYSG